MFEPKTLSFRVGLAVSAVSLALATVTQVSAGVSSIKKDSYVTGILLLLLGALLGFGAYFNGAALMVDLR